MSEKINDCNDKNCLSDDCLQCGLLTPKTKKELIYKKDDENE